MTISDEMLMAYADGELDAASRARVEAAMQEDPEIGKRVARHRALRETMQGAFSDVLNEPVPERLIQAARGQTAAPKSAVVDLSAAREAARRKIRRPCVGNRPRSPPVSCSVWGWDFWRGMGPAA
jgi:anti-sigma factor RsiW